MKYRSFIALLLATCAISANASEQDTRNKIALGALAFSDNCRKCHQIDGYGEDALYPSLHDPVLLANKPLLIKTILHGRMEQQRDGTEQPLMPSLDFLTNREIAAIIAFISNSWGSDLLLVSEEEIAAAR